MDNDIPEFEGFTCPLPLRQNARIILGHGSGGKLSRDLIETLFLPPFDNPVLRRGDDAGVIQLGETLRVALSTDAHVVNPLFFPGGDIGRLAICGTVNDIAMMGAEPKYLTASFILEEGLETSQLIQITNSMRAAAIESGVQIIAGDTKVVQKGKVDKVFINTTGMGVVHENTNISGSNAQPGDVVIVSGTMGDHGIAVLSARGELGFEADVESDVAPLNKMVSEMISAAQGGQRQNGIHVLRDPTRGGLATTLNEIAQQSQISILIDEESIPIRPSVAAVCEILGFDPLYIANEGKLIAFVGEDCAEDVLDSMHSNRFGQGAAIIGKVLAEPPGKVLMKTSIGTTRIIDMLAGELLPRIC